MRAYMRRAVERSHSRQARIALSISALSQATAGCADLLGVPGDPRLMNDSSASPTLVQQAPGMGIEPSSGRMQDIAARPNAYVATEPTEGQPGSLQLGGSGSQSPSTLSTGAPEPEASDAGPPSASPPPIDAGSPSPRVAAIPAAVCASPGVLGPNGSCYTTVTTLLNWANARQHCRSLGAGWDLASIRSDEVNQFLTGLLNNDAWIGGSDSSTEGTWIWVDDQTSFWSGDGTGGPVNAAYANWYRTEPNGGGNSGCARLVTALAGTWADLTCTDLFGAVCEGPPE